MNGPANKLAGMIETLRLAAHARCRVKTWRLTSDQAWELAGCGFDSRLSQYEIYLGMLAGRQSILGARIVVLDAELMSIQRGGQGR